MDAIYIPQDWERPRRPPPMPEPALDKELIFDYRMLDYVSGYDEHLECPICRCPFIKPVSLLGCQHFFCNDCIRQTWSHGQNAQYGDCPSCRRSTEIALGPTSAATKILVKIIEDLEVFCPNAQGACMAAVKRGDLADHIKLYCGYTLVDCVEESCPHQMSRKNLVNGCQHYPVSCAACRNELLSAELESHWRKDCAVRVRQCQECMEEVLVEDFELHQDKTCPQLIHICPGSELGCSLIHSSDLILEHIRTCVFAKLAPVLAAQTQRLSEQEAAQRQMNRKLDLLEQGLTNVQQMLVPRSLTSEMVDFDPARARPRASQLPDHHENDVSIPPFEGFDTSNSLPTPAQPFVSPMHHLLTMNENLHSEVSRLRTALVELDGRQSMHTLNENLRTRDELAYLGGQVAGISRQVQWLTSAQLQRPSDPTAREYNENASSGTGVEAAVHAVASAVRSAARLASSSSVSSTTMAPLTRRSTNEENRTKL